jgi:hypothetical protein
MTELGGPVAPAMIRGMKPSPEECSAERRIEEDEAWREWRDAQRKCGKMRRSRVYTGIMSLAGAYSRRNGGGR